MLIVLLDCSSSMDGPSQGQIMLNDMRSFAPGARKIDTARVALLRCLASTPPSEDVVILGFDERVVELARGCSINIADLVSRIVAWQSKGRANIPAALATAVEILRSDLVQGYRRLILISDALLDERWDGALDVVIRQLQALAETIDIKLVNLSPRGLEIARRIVSHSGMIVIESTGGPATPRFGRASDAMEPSTDEPDEPDGQWSSTRAPAAISSLPYGSPEELTVMAALVTRERSSAKKGATTVPARMIPQADRGLRSLEVGIPGVPCVLPRVSAGPDLAPSDAENVAVTVAHMPIVDRSRWYPLDIFVHVASLEDEVNRIVRAERGHGVVRVNRGTKLPRGAVVRIEPHIENAELDVESLTMRWVEDVQRVSFRFRAAPGAICLRGSVDLYLEQALLCSVPITVMVRDVPEEATPISVATGRMVEAVFVSYATEERWIVERVTRPYHQLGIAVFMDKDFLHVGDTTSETLRLHIERADVFQLFWSTRSSKKPWVEREWRHALTLTGPAGRKGARFIRPLVWERRPPGWPPELVPLQFGRLDITWFARTGARWSVVAGMGLLAMIALAIFAFGG